MQVHCVRITLLSLFVSVTGLALIPHLRRSTHHWINQIKNAFFKKEEVVSIYMTFISTCPQWSLHDPIYIRIDLCKRDIATSYKTKNHNLERESFRSQCRSFPYSDSVVSCSLHVWRLLLSSHSLFPTYTYCCLRFLSAAQKKLCRCQMSCLQLLLWIWRERKRTRA